MKLIYFRIFVARASQISLLDNTTISKPELIKKAFTFQEGPVYFNAGDKRYAFVVNEVTQNYVYASLAKQTYVNIQHSPEEGFERESMETWPNIPIIINTSGDSQIGQSLAVELDKSIFEYPHVQIKRLITELNRQVLRSLGYEMALNPITERHEFWDAISHNEGAINSVEFNFSAPNLFGTNDSLNEELREARDSFGMTKASVKIENSEGQLRVPNNSQFMNQGIQYVTEGGGEYKIHLTNKRIITSEESVKSKIVDETELKIAANNPETLKDFCDTLFSWLKH